MEFISKNKKERKMKRLATLTGVMMSLAIAASAQTTLPYNTGFDNTSQKAGWQSFRKGSTLATNWLFSEDFSDGYTAPSAPNCIQHPYPTIGDGTVLTDDWYVSPGLNLATGAKLSFKIGVYSFTGDLATGDTIQVYLLKGNPNPSMASSKTLLASMAYMKATNHNFKDTANIVVPAATGNAYIAFRYTSFNDWFTVAIDDIKLVAGTTTGIDDRKETAIDLALYPNPAKESIHWNYTAIAADKLEGQLIDVSGRTISTFPLKSKQLDISALQPGTYFLKSGNKAIPFTKE